MNLIFKPFDIDFILSISILTALVAMVNIVIGYIANASKIIKEIDTKNSQDGKVQYRLTSKLEQLTLFNHKWYANSIFRCFVFLIAIYFFLLIFKNINTDFINIESIALTTSEKWSVIITLKDSTIVTNNVNVVLTMIATALTWVQIGLFILTYVFVIILIKNYKDLILGKK